MKVLQIAGICAGILLLAAPTLEAQTIPSESRQYDKTRSPDDFTDEEIAKFSKVLKSVEKVQTKAQKEMDQVFADNGMTRESFNNLAERVKNSSSDNRPSDEEMEKFARINKEMMSAERKIQPELTRIVEESGIHMRDYEDKLKAYREDDAFRKKVQARM